MVRFGLVSVSFAALALALGGCASEDAAPIEHAANALTSVVPEGAGANCEAGGQAFHIGVDTNGNGILDPDEVTGTTYLCNGKNGVDGALGAKGDQGAAGAQGIQGEKGDAGDQGAAAPEVKLGQFLPSQVVGGLVITCATVNLAASTNECRGMKVDGLDAYLGPDEATAICKAITGAGFNSASGLAQVNGPYMTIKAGAWTLGTGTVSPMQNLSCNKAI